MFIFTFLLLPLMLCLYCFNHRENKNLPVICIGFMAAVVVCSIRMFFFFPHRVIPYSFMGNFSYFLIKEYMLPTVLLYVVFFLISKDPIEYKINSIFPLEISFYIVYFPYTLINSSSGMNEPFSLIIKPMLYVSMFAAIWFSSSEIMKLIKNKKMIWLAIIHVIVIFIYLIGPAFIESVYLMNTKLWFAVISSLCYFIYPFVYCIFKVIKNINGGYEEKNSIRFDKTESDSNVFNTGFDFDFENK